MRLHHLEIQAFGPFADRQSVDFDALSSQGLFLLNGPTGAGKSSVLDAVCFALYGSVPGARHAAKRLRSDHAADGVAPEVSLEFSAGGRRYRVVRSPSWERPAKRGGGTTSEQARTLLSEYVAGEWVQKSARNDEAGLELQTLLGMDKDQFTKVVMLPQGEFAAFLRADAKPRRELLQRLFSTARFEDLESHLTEQGHRAAREVSEHEERQRNLLLRAVEEAERHDVSALELDVDPETVSDRAGAVQTLTEALAERREAAEAQSTDLAERSALADGALSALRRRRERRDALRRLQYQRAEHEALGKDVGPATELLRRHDEALGLSTLLHLEDEARTSAEEATESHRLAVARLGHNAVVSAFMKGDAEAPTERSGTVLTTACAAATAALTMLRAALPDEERLLAIRSGLTTADARLVQIVDRTVDIDVEIERLRSARSAATRDLAAARVAAEGIEHLRAELTAAETAEALVVQYEDARRRLDTAEDTHRDAAARFLELKEHWLALLQRRLEEAAVELADRLQPGQACAVCGSLDHPRPASSGGTGRITLEEEQSARDVQAAAEEALYEVRDVRDATRLEVADLGARGGGVGRQEAAARARTARGAVDGAQAAEVRVRSLDRQIERMVQEEDASTAAREALRDEQSTVASRRVSWLEQEASLVERLAELQRDAPSLSARLEAVEAAAADLDAARSALDALLGAQDALTRSRHRLQDALKDTAFATGDAARDALLHEVERIRLTTLVKDHETQGHRLEAAWSDDAVQESLREEQDGVPAPTDDDEARSGAEAESLRARAHTAGIGAEVLAQSVAQLKTYARRLADLEAVAGPLRSRARMIIGLAETARGGGENLYKMPLATYVLASRLEQVAAAATERLLQMSDGRYALVHSDATSGNRRSGLGLNVIDGWTGNRRDTATLSGGESFMASLALALGLADVVQQESGGLDIETLFVDEGFGSLDDQALEQVMDALEGLRSGGRVVGLVSHVPELKQRVGAQLQVLKGRQGSTLHFVEQPVSV